jgi:zinc finger CCHC domain-containing protein 8
LCEFRYHDEGEQKYPHHRPGVVSDELRAALNLRPDQLPMHIYLMRLYGYPPGWMQEAKQTLSGITLLGGMVLFDWQFTDGEKYIMDFRG